MDNATRFARHITRCPNATKEDRDLARSHLAGMAEEQIRAINDNAEFTRAFDLDGKAHVRSLFEDTKATRQVAIADRPTVLSILCIYHDKS